MINVSILGRIVTEPSWLQSKNGGNKNLKVLVSCATDAKNTDTGYYITNLFVCHFWGKIADIVAENFNKGDRIAVTGRGKLSTWKSEKDGEFHAAIDITAYGFDFVSEKTDLGTTVINATGGDINY